MSKPHKHAELIKLWADGAQIQYQLIADGEWRDIFEPSWSIAYKYRIKPQPKPDQIHIARVRLLDAGSGAQAYFVNLFDEHGGKVQFTFDGETNELKAVEMVK